MNNLESLNKVTLSMPELLYCHVNDAFEIPKNAKAYLIDEFPHWHIYKMLHIDKSIEPNVLKDNAKVIGSIPNSIIRNVTFNELVNRGLKYTVETIY